MTRIVEVTDEFNELLAHHGCDEVVVDLDAWDLGSLDRGMRLLAEAWVIVNAEEGEDVPRH